VGGFTLGLDLGARAHHVCVLDATGQIDREAALPNTRPALTQLLAEFSRATVALEAGTHSPWISRQLTDPGAQAWDYVVCRAGIIHSAALWQIRFGGPTVNLRFKRRWI